MVYVGYRCFIEIHCGAYRLLSQPSFLSFIDQLLLRKIYSLDNVFCLINYFYFCEQHSSAAVVFLLSFLFLSKMFLHVHVCMILSIADQ